jgi:hypothetical protein
MSLSGAMRELAYNRPNLSLVHNRTNVMIKQSVTLDRDKQKIALFIQYH